MIWAMAVSYPMHTANFFAFVRFFLFLFYFSLIFHFVFCFTVSTATAEERKSRKCHNGIECGVWVIWGRLCIACLIEQIGNREWYLRFYLMNGLPIHDNNMVTFVLCMLHAQQKVRKLLATRVSGSSFIRLIKTRFNGGTRVLLPHEIHTSHKMYIK